MFFIPFIYALFGFAKIRFFSLFSLNSPLRYQNSHWQFLHIDTKVKQKIKNSFLFSALRAIETATGSFFITYPAHLPPLPG